MRRYFFDIHDGEGVISDEEGMELLNMDAVQDEAANALMDIARSRVRSANGNGSVRQLTIEVRDEGGLVICAKFTFEIERLQ